MAHPNRRIHTYKAYKELLGVEGVLSKDQIKVAEMYEEKLPLQEVAKKMRRSHAWVQQTYNSAMNKIEYAIISRFIQEADIEVLSGRPKKQ